MWQILDYCSDYLDDIISMTIENYGSDINISQKNFIMHEYFSNPVGDALIKVAFDSENKTVAGQYVLAPQRFRVDDDEILACESLNTLTRKAYRGQGVFTSLATSAINHASEKGYAFVYGAPNPNSSPTFTRKLDFNKIVEMPLYMSLLKPSKVARDKLGAFASFLLKPFDLFTVLPTIKNQNIVPINETNITLLDDFWNKIKNKYMIIGVRDSIYFKYRYLDVPCRSYHPFFYLKDGVPVAYAVYRIRDVAKISTGMIADFLYLDGYEKEAKELLRFIKKDIKNNNAGLCGCIMLSHCSEAKVLRSAFFVKCPDKLLPQPTPLIIKVLNSRISDKILLNINNWFFTTGDYDVV